MLQDPVQTGVVAPTAFAPAIAPESAGVRFADLGLSAPLLRALADRGYEVPTPIQAQAIPHLLEGRDLLGVAQTGTGKTAAFALPMLFRLGTARRRAEPRRPRALVLTPTRELASQISASFETYGRHLALRHCVVFGGVGQNPQVQALRRGVDVLVATPGRLLDLVGQRCVDLSNVEIFVLDEADRMLDMGFIRDVQRIVETLPTARQSLLFSATMPDDIVRLADGMLVDPIRVEVTPPATTVERVEQRVFFVEGPDKRALLATVLDDAAVDRVLVFARTKHGADKIVKFLDQEGYRAVAIHGNKSQGARERALEGFRRGKTRILVATDIAARGIDVPGITHVINFDLPNVPEDYVHRIGRTARAGRDGIALSFCGADERGYLADIERTTRQDLTVVADHPYVSQVPFGRRPIRGAASHQGRSARGPRRFSRGSGRPPQGARNTNHARRPRR